jgi:hypothetical protein
VKIVKGKRRIQHFDKLSVTKEELRSKKYEVRNLKCYKKSLSDFYLTGFE